MKKAVLLAIIITCFASGALIFQPYAGRQIPAPARFLPEDTLIYINLREPQKFFHNAAQSQMGRELQSIDFVKLALDLEVPLEGVAILRNIREQFSTEHGERLFTELFSNDLTLAVLPSENETEVSKYFTNNLLVFAEPKHSARVIQTKMRDISDSTVDISQYGRYFIYRLNTFLNSPISVVFIGQRLIISFDERNLRRALDRYDEQQRNLSENYFFQEFRNRYAQDKFYTFVDLRNLRIQLKRLFPDMASIYPQESNVFEMMQGFNAGAYSFGLENGMRRDKIAIHYNESELKQDIGYFLDIQPAKDIHFEKSPRDTLLYFWTNTFDLNALWDLLTTRADIDSILLQSFEDSIALTAGVPFDELLGMVGNHFHFILRPPSPNDPVPLPNFTIIFNLADEQKARTTMQQLFLLNEIPHNNDIYRGVPFTYWGRDMQNGLQPVYAFYNNSVYFSTSVQTQLEIVDTLHDRNGLTSTYGYNMVSKPLFNVNNSHGFIQIPEMVDVLKELISIGEAMYSRQNRKAAYRTQKIVYSLVYPLLDGLKTYSSTAVRSYNEPGKLIIETRAVPAQASIQ
ncbi:MAG: DUF3352 domain-containing protein [Desulfocapsaceae bacterium]|nr:DUF3352 domain-containing protein [Desulfocapsaceae bacterium]